MRAGDEPYHIWEVPSWNIFAAESQFGAEDNFDLSATVLLEIDEAERLFQIAG